MRSAIVFIALVVSALSAGCGGDFQGEVCSSGPCPSGPHHWTARELARDMASANFPPAVNMRDHLYRISCRITNTGSRAVCVGVRRFGAYPGQRVVAHTLLRENGTWDLLCWPNPSQLCDRVQMREQRANPITS
jgi:hypothetical protein